MKLVVCFPGIGYHCDKPLLYYSRKLAACAGYDHTLLLQYTYHKDGLRGNPAALHEAFDTLYAQVEAQLSAVDWPQYDDVLFLSKSIGTVHCDDPTGLRKKPALAALLDTGAFAKAVFLSGRSRPGAVAQWVTL